MRPHLLLAVAAGVLCACTERDAPDDQLRPVRPPDIPRVVSAREALDSAHIPAMDPLTMNDAEISKVLGQGSFCAFRYTSAGKPVLAVKPQGADSQAEGVVKLNGLLVALHESAAPDRLVMTADNVRLTMTFADRRSDAAPGARMREADLLFEIDQRLRVGYRGYYVCGT